MQAVSFQVAAPKLRDKILLGTKTYAKGAALYPGVSLSMKICAQRKTGKRKRARRTSPCFFLFPMVPCYSSPVTRVLRSPLRLSRSQCQGIEVKTTVIRILPHSRFCLEIKTAERKTVGCKTLNKIS